MEILDSEETVIPHSELTTHPCSSEADSSDDEPIRTTLIPVFPTEVFERIIDYSSQIVVGLWWYDTAPDYRTLRACALTCSAWLPRSRYNLLSTVRLTTKSQLMTLAQCLSATPHFCHLVRDLRVIYYTRGNVQPLLSFPAVLAHIFPHVTTLTLQSDGRGPIPGHLDTRFTPSFLPISGMTSITELNLIRISFGTPKECAYLVCELPNLRTLRCIRVYWNTSREGPMEIRRRQSASCLKLESLTIVTSGEHSGAFSILCDWTCFLHAVKHHLRRFHFTCINSRVRREEIPFLGTLRKLQSLALAATLSVNFLPEHFYKVLQKCSFVNTLHTLALVFSLDYRSREAIRNTYWARLDGLLTITFAHVETVSLRVFLGPSLTWTFNPEVLMPNLWTQRAVSIWMDWIRRNKISLARILVLISHARPENTFSLAGWQRKDARRSREEQDSEVRGRRERRRHRVVGVQLQRRAAPPLSRRRRGRREGWSGLREYLLIGCPGPWCVQLRSLVA